MKDRRSVCG